RETQQTVPARQEPRLLLYLESLAGDFESPNVRFFPEFSAFWKIRLYEEEPSVLLQLGIRCRGGKVSYGMLTKAEIQVRKCGKIVFLPHRSPNTSRVLNHRGITFPLFLFPSSFSCHSARSQAQ